MAGRFRACAGWASRSPCVSFRPSVSALLLCSSALLGATSLAAPPGNLLVILADDVGVDMVPVYGVGADLPVLPVIDGLAAQGVLFRNAYAHPSCSPTRAAIQTGRYPFRTGIGTEVNEKAEVGLRPEEITMPEMLDVGTGGQWAHALFGKWHLHGPEQFGYTAPNDAGWGHYEGAIDNLSARVSNGYYDWQKVTNGVVTMSTTYATTDTVDGATAWLAGATEPWLCMVAFHAAHDPWEAPPPELCTEDLSGAPPASQAPRPYYKATIEAMDKELGRLLQSLAPDVLANTTVVFLGDNGTPAPVALPPLTQSTAKGSVFEGGIRVPMIVTGPHVQQPGSESHAFVHAVDLFATAADIAGVPFDVTFPGTLLDAHSLLPLLADPTAPSQRTHVFSERFKPNLDAGLPPPSFLCQEDLGLAGPGTSALSVCGEPLFPDHVAALRLVNAPPSSPGFLIASKEFEPIALAGGMILPSPYFAVVPTATDGLGELSIMVPGGTKTVGGALMHCQAAVASPALPYGWDLSNAVRLRFFDHPISSRAIRNAAGYKLAVYVKQMKAGDTIKKTLHDLANDPLETTDLLSSGVGLTGEQAAALAELEAALAALLATGPQG